MAYAKWVFLLPGKPGAADLIDQLAGGIQIQLKRQGLRPTVFDAIQSGRTRRFIMEKEHTIITMNGKRFRCRPAVSMLCYQGESPQIYAMEELPDDFVEPLEEVYEEPPLSQVEIEEFNSEYQTHFWRIRKKGFRDLFMSKGWDPVGYGALKSVGGKLRVMYREEEHEHHYVCGFRLKWASDRNK